MDVEEFRRVGHQLIDWIADYRAHVGELPVMARVAPGDVMARLPTTPPETPESFDAIVADLDRIIVPGLSHVQHPRFFGYFPANGELASVLYLTPRSLTAAEWCASPSARTPPSASTSRRCGSSCGRRPSTTAYRGVPRTLRQRSARRGVMCVGAFCERPAAPKVTYSA